MSHEVVRFQFGYPGKFSNCFLELTHVRVANPKAIVDIHIIGIQGQGSLKLLHCLFQPPAFIKPISTDIQAGRVKESLGIGPEEPCMGQCLAAVVQHVLLGKTQTGINADTHLHRGAQCRFDSLTNSPPPFFGRISICAGQKHPEPIWSRPIHYSVYRTFTFTRRKDTFSPMCSPF